jgi:hypothetical protein
VGENTQSMVFTNIWVFAIGLDLFSVKSSGKKERPRKKP